MLPNSIEYYLFIGMLIAAIAAIKNYQHLMLLAASIAFYSVTSQLFVWPLLLVILITYFGGRSFKIYPEKKKILLALVIIGVIGQLAFFKYIPGLVLPLGISYYSFMALGYVIEVYRGKLSPENSIIEYALFVSFFPVITSGPIIRFRDFFTQIRDHLKITPENFQQGITLITIGLIMKLVIADNLAPYVDPIFADPIKFQSREIIRATLAFGMQLYCDFGGYSNIALGTARMLGFTFPMNFNNPYLSMNPQDFWHRWNISLSCWLRDYLYIPLGGNRKGTIRTYFNLMITMVACGLWHGATWNFLLWGGYHGALLSLHRMIRIPQNKFLSLIGLLITQYLIFVGWLIFKVKNVSDLEYCLNKFLIPSGFSFMDLVVAGAIIAVLLLLRNKIANNNWISRIGSLRLSYWFFYLVIAINLIYWASPVKVTKFIYAGF
jgi:alginate O-acetyltransferase complex protein AlgI